MRIALLATQQTGKTCYLSSLHGELQDLINFPRETAPLTFSLMNTVQHGILNRQYKGLLRGEMPNATDGHDCFPLRINHRMNDANTTIELVDFPGGRLERDGDPKEVENVISLLSGCDAFIILIDARYAGLSGRIFRAEIAASAVNEILSAVVKNKAGTKFSTHGIPFIFAISKSDKILHDWNLILNAYSNVMKFFPLCFSADTKCVSCITQISLGDNIDGADAKERGEYKPMNIEIPFFLALGLGTLSGAKFQHAERDRLKEQRDAARRFHATEQSAAQSAQATFARRRDSNILERMEQFFFEDFELESELKDRADRYKLDEDRALARYHEKVQSLSEKIKEIDDLRSIGAAALEQIIKSYSFAGERPNAVIYQYGKKHRLKESISSEIITPLEEL